MGTLVKETKKNGEIRWRAEVRRKGHRFTKRFTLKTHAKDWLNATETKIVQGKVDVHSSVRVSEAIDRYLAEILPRKKEGTQEVQRPQLMWFKTQLGDKKLSEISVNTLSTLRERLITEKKIRMNHKSETQITRGTANRYFTLFAHLLNCCKTEWGWLSEVPRLKRYKETIGRERFLTPSEAKALYEALEVHERDDFRIICLISLLTGSRLHETCSLKWCDVDLSNGSIHFQNTKSGYPRTVPIQATLQNELLEWKGQSTSEYLFPSNGLGERGYTYDSISKTFRKLAKELGLQGVTFHTLRHTFASWATQRGESRKFIADILGHRDLRTTERYAHINTSHLKGTSDTVEEILLDAIQ